MSKYKYIILLFSLSAALLFYTGCPGTEPTEPENLTINIPITVEFTASDSNETIFGIRDFCLSESPEWNNNKYSIKSAKFKEASYWTLSNSPNLKGEFKFSILSESDYELISDSEPNFDAAAWVGNPRKLNLSSAEIGSLDWRLEQAIGPEASDVCLIASVTMTNVTGEKNSDNEYALKGKVTIILEAEKDRESY